MSSIGHKDAMHVITDAKNYLEIGDRHPTCRMSMCSEFHETSCAGRVWPVDNMGMLGFEFGHLLYKIWQHNG